MSMDFNYYLPVNIVFGRGKVSSVGIIASDHGKKALVVTGKSSTKRSGLLNRICSHLKKSGIEYTVFDKVPQNPLTTTAEQAARIAKDNGCDMVIGVGGGSVMDCAKAAAFIAVNDGDINDYIFNRLKSGKALPIILIPTTCGTGSEGNGFAVLTNPENGDKKSLRCNAQPFTDIMCEKAMKLIADDLPKLFKGDNNPEYWDKISLASTMGGMVINTAGVTLAHGMEHPVSGFKNAVHGKGLAAITPAVTEASIKGDPQKLAFISKVLGGNNENDCAEQITKFIDSLRLTCTLSDFGVKESDIDMLTDSCMKVSAAGISYHPVKFDRSHIRDLYLKSL